jgi:membrane protein
VVTWGGGLLENISNTLGKEGAEQVRQVVRSIYGFSDSWYVIVLGFIFLVFVATTLFGEIKNSLDQLWKISVKEHPGLLFLLSARAKSFAVILLAGILFFADVFLESLEVIAGNYIDEIWHWGSSFFKSAVHQIASVIIVAAWFHSFIPFPGGWETYMESICYRRITDGDLIHCRKTCY